MATARHMLWGGNADLLSGAGFGRVADRAAGTVRAAAIWKGICAGAER